MFLFDLFHHINILKLTLQEYNNISNYTFNIDYFGFFISAYRAYLHV